VKFARWISWPLLAIGLGSFFWAPSPSYGGQTYVGTPTSLVASCVTPWTSWTKHIYATTDDTSTLIPVDQTRDDRVCAHWIRNFEVFGAVLLPSGLAGLVVVSMAKRKRAGSDQAACDF
jgi:hypothetical protein